MNWDASVVSNNAFEEYAGIARRFP